MSWHIVTYFVLILIALQDLRIREALVQSWLMVRNSVFELMGGTSWFLLIVSLALIPFAALTSTGFPGIGFALLLLALEFLGGSLIMCAMTIFNVMVYREYNKRFPNIEELTELNFPNYF
jgi:hypothetical protein